METVFAIRTAARNYDESLALDLVDPPSAKNAVGAPGNAKKEQVYAAMHKMLDALVYDKTEYDLEFSKLDEHSVDALAIAFWRMKKLQQE
jgi:Holliday junction resolvasome RuvABC endonuclease subunit